FARAAVADDADPVDPQERRAAVLAVVVAVDEILQGLLPQRLLRLERFEQLLAGHLHRKLEDTLAHLQDHVADEAVRDDHVADALVDIAAFDIADETLAQSTGVEKSVRLLGEVVPLGLFRADIHQADGGRLALKDVAGEDAAHNTVLKEMLRLGADV